MRAFVGFLGAAIALGGCKGSSAAPKQPDGAASSVTPTSASAAPGSLSANAASAMLPDEAISAAIAGKQEILVVRVQKIDTAAPGTRSETTTYTLDIVRAALGSSSGTVRLSHYGAPRMTAAKLYAISTRDGNPMWGTKGVRESVEIADGAEDAAAKAHAKRANELGATR